MQPRLSGITACFVTAGLTGISGAATTHSTGSTTIQYAIAGKSYSQAQISGGATPTTGAVSGAAITLTASQARVVVWCLDADDDIAIIEGDVVALDADTDTFKDGFGPEFPPIDLDVYCPIAYVIHLAAAALSGTFTVGSSNWNTTGMTHTVVDIATLPHRPQTS